MLIPLLMLGSGFAAIIAVLATTEKNPPVHEPDEAPVPPSPLGVTPPPGATPLGKSGYKLVDQILPALQAASLSSQIPLGVLVGWIARESGGKLSDTTKYDERGYFQLMPDESKALGLDHQRLSTDSTYSINAGLLLIGKYMKQAVALGIAPQGSSFFWKLVKLIHSMGLGAVQKIVAAAKADGSTTSWSALEQFAMDHNSELLHVTKHSPSKWFPFVNKCAATGAQYGFGSDTMVVGGSGTEGSVGYGYKDIPDPLAMLPKYRRRKTS